MVSLGHNELSLFLEFQLTINQHWFRWWLGAKQATSHYLKQCWLRTMPLQSFPRAQWVNPLFKTHQSRLCFIWEYNVEDTQQTLISIYIYWPNVSPIILYFTPTTIQWSIKTENCQQYVDTHSLSNSLGNYENTCRCRHLHWSYGDFVLTC